MSAETDKLRKNIQEQLDRLVKQMAELDEYKSELSADEYESMKDDTKEQLKEFSATLAKLCAGNISLVDDLTAMRMAVQAAISEAFKTPEVISLFARKQPAQLRMKLEEVERDRKIGHLQQQIYIDKKLEILAALKHLNEQLSLSENEFLTAHSANNALMNQFALAGTMDDGGSNKQIESLVDASMAKS